MAFGGFLSGDRADVKTTLRVKARICGRQAQSARWNFAEAAPLARYNGEDLVHERTGGRVAVGAHRARVRVLDLGPSLLELKNTTMNTLE